MEILAYNARLRDPVRRVRPGRRPCVARHRSVQRLAGSPLTTVAVARDAYPLWATYPARFVSVAPTEGRAGRRMAEYGNG
jgi:hypothetical protein